MTQAGAQEYLLAPGDRIEVSVFARPDISKQYRIRTDGTISMHLIGSIQAADLSPAKLETRIEARLGVFFDEPVSTTLEVADWRPVVVSGDVMEPGAIVFRPGTDVRAALAEAGGAIRGLPTGDSGSAMRVQSEVGDLAQYEARLAPLLAERSRLIGETTTGQEPTDGRDPVLAAMEDLVGGEVAAELVAAQALLAERETQQSILEKAARQTQQALAASEADAYGTRQEIIGEQLALTRDELIKQEELLERRISIASKVLDLRQDATSLRSEELEAVGLQAAAEQKRDRAIAGQQLAEATRARDVAVRLTQLEAEITELNARIAQSRVFIENFGGAALLMDAKVRTETYMVYRRTGTGLRRQEVGADMLLHPGDILEVTVATEPLGQ
ncbi:polysaccharide biosynthesis/export family protein [Leisingera sp. S232]|uniref:polysaccharide biosynthesis/export family protein n=1 Tax=Leisingera sp. S232 TaxID=3415132 RepID=UPI003C7A181D